MIIEQVSQFKRGKLYEQYLRILKSGNPDFFVFENVVGMVSANKGAAYQAIQEDFKNAGYDLVFNDIINMASLGVAQARKRLILIGVKNQFSNNQIKNIIDTHLKNNILEKYPLVPLEVFEGKVLTNLQDEYVKIMKQYSNSMDDIDNEYSEKWKEEYNNLTFNIKEDYLSCNNADYDEEEFKQAMIQHENILKVLGYFNRKIDEQSFLDDTNNRGRKNKKVIERMHHIPPYYNFKAVDNTPWKVKGLMSNIYKRIHPLKPSPTIIAYGGGGTGGYHYEYDRQGLTNRERARLQTFPDNYLFNGKSTEIRAQIGKQFLL